MGPLPCSRNKLSLSLCVAGAGAYLTPFSGMPLGSVFFLQKFHDLGSESTKIPCFVLIWVVNFLQKFHDLGSESTKIP